MCKAASRFWYKWINHRLCVYILFGVVLTLSTMLSLMYFFFTYSCLTLEKIVSVTCVLSMYFIVVCVEYHWNISKILVVGVSSGDRWSKYCSVSSDWVASPFFSIFRVSTNSPFSQFWPRFYRLAVFSIFPRFHKLAVFAIFPLFYKSAVFLRLGCATCMSRLTWIYTRVIG